MKLTRDHTERDWYLTGQCLHMYLEEMNLSTRLECETVIFEIELCQGDSANTIIVFTGTAEWPEPLSNSF